MKLSDFRDEKAIEVVADLLPHIGAIASNKDTAAVREEGGTIADFASAMLKNNSRDVLAMLAILNDQAPEDYHCTAATVLVDTFNMVSDPELLALFGLQRQTAASSGSASETTEAPKP